MRVNDRYSRKQGIIEDERTLRDNHDEPRRKARDAIRNAETARKQGSPLTASELKETR